MAATSGLTTTVIGSFPKPEYLKIPDWFQTNKSLSTESNNEWLASQSAETADALEKDILRAAEEVIRIQRECGIDIVTDGEVRRENYIHHLCRSVENIDFENLGETSWRGSGTKKLPVVCGKVAWRATVSLTCCAEEWRKAQDLLPGMDVKYTLPGPMTIIGTTCNKYYEEEKDLAADLADIINLHVRALAHAGCKHIQVDEPLFARRPEAALAWGIKSLEHCFDGVGDGCERSVHMCCGYPDFLDQADYVKASPDAYFQIAQAIDESCVDAVSIEDAHRHNDLKLLECYKKTKVIFGSIATASSRIETVEEIQKRLEDALQHIDAERLIVAPDCGLGYLPVPIIQQKLTNMCVAAKRCACQPSKRRRISLDGELEAVA